MAESQNNNGPITITDRKTLALHAKDASLGWRMRMMGASMMMAGFVTIFISFPVGVSTALSAMLWKGLMTRKYAGVTKQVQEGLQYRGGELFFEACADGDAEEIGSYLRSNAGQGNVELLKAGNYRAVRTAFEHQNLETATIFMSLGAYLKKEEWLQKALRSDNHGIFRSLLKPQDDETPDARETRMKLLNLVVTAIHKSKDKKLAQDLYAFENGALIKEANDYANESSQPGASTKKKRKRFFGGPRP